MPPLLEWSLFLCSWMVYVIFSVHHIVLIII